jgi:PAS domain S-box-containing protein
LPSGEQRWLETNKVPLRDLAGNVVGVVGTFQDISDRKVAEVALAASESFNRQLVEEFPLGLAACRLDGQITYVNSAFAKILGRTIEEVLSLTYWDITPIKYAEQEAEQLQSLKQHGRYGPYEKEFVHKDGHLVPVLLTGLAISQNGEKFIWSSIQDISERKRSEEEIQRLSERLTVALKSGAIGCWEWDILPNTLVWDRRMHELYGIEPSISLLPFDVWSNGVHPDDRSSSQALLQQAVLGQAEFDTEFRVVYPDGSIHFIKGCGVVVRDADGTPQRMIGVNFDISDRKNAEEEIQRKNQELARATRLKDEFLANMSHELRTPLNAILGMAEGLQEEVFGVIEKRQIRALQTIERSGLHLLSLINDILDVAKIEAGQIELEYTSISVTHLCSSSLVFIKQQALQKRIRLETKFAPDLTNAFVDERRIRQVLINLLTNAVKFTPEGGTVTLTASPLPQADDATQQHYLRIAVSDTGIGIAPENINKLFQPFVQIDSALNRQYAGTGLGLALVKQIVELHGGRVGLTSELGLGSCFTIDLPCKTELPLTINLPMTSQDDISSMVSEAPLTAPLILLAEDNEANISTISSYLTAKGYRVILAKNGEEAIAMAYSESPDLILMDIQMPEVDGLTAIRQLRHDPNFGNIPIIALTALAMASDRERCLEAGANDYLSKPVRLKELTELIKGFCN